MLRDSLAQDGEGSRELFLLMLKGGKRRRGLRWLAQLAPPPNARANDVSGNLRWNSDERSG